MSTQKVSPWAPWDECDKSPGTQLQAPAILLRFWTDVTLGCGGGQQERNRQVTQNPQNGGKQSGTRARVVMDVNTVPRALGFRTWTEQHETAPVVATLFEGSPSRLCFTGACSSFSGASKIWWSCALRCPNSLKLASSKRKLPKDAGLQPTTLC